MGTETFEEAIERWDREIERMTDDTANLADDEMGINRPQVEMFQARGCGTYNKWEATYQVGDGRAYGKLVHTECRFPGKDFDVKLVRNRFDISIGSSSAKIRFIHKPMLKRYGAPGGENFSYLVTRGNEEVIIYARTMVEAMAIWANIFRTEPYSMRQMSDNE